MRRVLPIIFAFALLASLAWAQSSQPAGQSWPQAVRDLASALSESADAEALARSLPAGTGIRRFDRPEAQDRLSLRDATAGAIVLFARGYEKSPATVATDLSDAMREAPFIPQSVRSAFIIEGPTTTRRANETASQWVLGTLQPGVEQPVGVIALWREPPETDDASSSDPAMHGRLIFVLVKGQEKAPGDYRITSAIYGDMSQIVR